MEKSVVSSEGGKKIIALFDVDGTLTKARSPMDDQMRTVLNGYLDKGVHLAVVSGSDQKKILEQVDETIVKRMPFAFFENGLVTHKLGEKFEETSLQAALGNDKLKKFVNFCLSYLANIDVPTKTGTFVELRTGLINVCPVGRNCSREEREEFEKYDMEHQVRKTFVDVLKKEFDGFGLQFAIGGQISFDVFLEGWDKRFCLRYLKDYDEIHFFGDKTLQGGNDYEIYEDERTSGHSVKNPEETIAILEQLFGPPN